MLNSGDVPVASSVCEDPVLVPFGNMSGLEDRDFGFLLLVGIRFFLLSVNFRHGAPLSHGDFAIPEFEIAYFYCVVFLARAVRDCWETGMEGDFDS